MFKPRDIGAMVFSFINEPINEVDLLRFINDCIAQFSSRFWSLENQTYTVTNTDDLLPLPDNFIKSIGVDTDTSYQIRGQVIQFSKIGTHRLNYIACPKRLESLEEDINLPDVFLPIITKYVIYRLLTIESSKEAQQWKIEFDRGLSNITNEMETTNASFQVKEVW